MPHKRPPTKNRSNGDDLMRLMLVRDFLKKGSLGQQSGGGDVEEVDTQPEVQEQKSQPNSQPNSQQNSQPNAQQPAVQQNEPVTGEENGEDIQDEELEALEPPAVQPDGKPDYVFLGSGGSMSVASEPLLVTQLRELRRTIKKYPVVQLGGSDLQDFLKINKELADSVHVSKEACGQINRYARENILELARNLDYEVGYKQIGHQDLTRTADLAKLNQFLEKYENFQDWSSEFKTTYSEVKSLVKTIDQNLTQNDFQKNNQKLGSLLGLGNSFFGFTLGGQKKNDEQIGGSKTEINQLIRINQRMLDEKGESMIGSGLVNRFQKIQDNAYEKMSIGLRGGRHSGHDEDDEMSFSDNLSVGERQAKFQYMDAKQKLLQKQAELLEIKKSKLGGKRIF